MAMLRAAGRGFPALIVACALVVAGPLAAHEAHRQGQSETWHYTRSTADYRVPPLTLMDQNNVPVAIAEALSGAEPVVMQFVFTTCPAVCPVLSNTLAAVQDDLPPGTGKLRLISITIDPFYDTPKRLRSYAHDVGAEGAWTFLTGDPADVVAVQKAFDAYEGNKMRHIALTFLKTAPQAPWIRFEGFITPDQLIAEYRSLRKPR